jgi:hypothetical protein
LEARQVSLAGANKQKPSDAMQRNGFGKPTFFWIIEIIQSGKKIPKRLFGSEAMFQCRANKQKSQRCKAARRLWVRPLFGSLKIIRPKRC